MSTFTIAVVSRGVAGEALRGWTAGAGAAVEVDEVIDPVGDLDPRRRWPSPARAAAVIQVPGHHPDVVSGVMADRLLGILLVERRQHPRTGVEHPRPGPRGGLTQLSFVAPLAEMSPVDFDARYRDHMGIVASEHPGVAHYRQDIVVDRIGADPLLDDCAAVSQLWFPSDMDFAERYYASAASPDLVREDVERFLDYRRTWSVLTRQHHVAE